MEEFINIDKFNFYMYSTSGEVERGNLVFFIVTPAISIAKITKLKLV
jgi:hypothetical protein